MVRKSITIKKIPTILLSTTTSQSISVAQESHPIVKIVPIHLDLKEGGKIELLCEAGMFYIQLKPNTLFSLSLLIKKTVTIY